MKNIFVEDFVADFISGKLLQTGESATLFLRRELKIPDSIALQQQPEGNQLAKVLSDPVFIGRRSVASKFLYLLGVVYKRDPHEFERLLLSFQGRSRKYIAKSVDEFKKNKSAQPRQIPGSPYFVETLSSTKQKAAMAASMLKILGYNRQTINAVAESIRK